MYSFNEWLYPEGAMPWFEIAKAHARPILRYTVIASQTLGKLLDAFDINCRRRAQ
jgi:hypothetical protein